jgi:hypothetical protein
MTLRDEGLLPKRASGNGFAPAARSRTRHCGRQAPKDYADRLGMQGSFWLFLHEE